MHSTYSGIFQECEPETLSRECCAEGHTICIAELVRTSITAKQLSGRGDEHSTLESAAEVKDLLNDRFDNRAVHGSLIDHVECLHARRPATALTLPCLGFGVESRASLHLGHEQL